MSFETFISDLQKLPNVKDFESGKEKQRSHLNEVADAIRSIRLAADREAGAEGENGSGERTYRVIEDGVGVLRTFYVKE